MNALGQHERLFFFFFDTQSIAGHCYLPDDIIAMQGCYDLVRLLQHGQVPIPHAMASLDVLFSFSVGGVEGALRDIGTRAAVTLASDGELNAELRKLLQTLSRKGRTKMARSLLEGLERVAAEGGAVQRKAATTLAASLVGRWLPAPVVTLLIRSAHNDPVETNRVVAVEALSFLLDELGKEPGAATAEAFAVRIRKALRESASRDSTADVRCAALDALFPRGPGEPAPARETLRAVCERLADRSAKARARAAACLGAWGAARLLPGLAAADWQHVAKWGLAPRQSRKVTEPVSQLLLELLRGPDALQWLRRLELLHSPRHELLLRANATQIFPRLLSANAKPTNLPMADEDEEEEAAAAVNLGESDD